jgi:hypothetical protein
VKLAAHASLGSAAVRTAPRRLPTRENQLASKCLVSFQYGWDGADE